MSKRIRSPHKFFRNVPTNTTPITDTSETQPTKKKRVVQDEKEKEEL